MTEHNDEDNLIKIKKAFADLCKANGIKNLGKALSVSKAEGGLAITLDTSQLPDDGGLWIKVPKIQMALENAGIAKGDIDIRWETREKDGKTVAVPYNLKVTVPDNSIIKIIEFKNAHFKEPFQRVQNGVQWGWSGR